MSTHHPGPHPGLVAAVTLAGSRNRLAEMAGVSHNLIDHYWQSGNPLRAKTAAKIAKAVGIKASVLMESRQ